MSANEQLFVGAQTVVSLLQTTQIISDICFITDHDAYASSNKTTIVWIVTELFFFTRAGCASCLRAFLGTSGLLPQSYQYPNLSEGADRVGGQLRGDKSGRVWRKVPESDARSVYSELHPVSPSFLFCFSVALHTQPPGSLRSGSPRRKLQALVYDILHSTTAGFSYAIGPRKLSANEQFFVVGAQTAGCKQLKLYQTFVL